MNCNDYLRLLRKVTVKGPDECWLWNGGTIHNGYGKAWIDGGVHLVHRAVYTYTKGAIPEGLFVIHSCDNRLCVNPNHLRTGTRADNARDMVTRDRQWKKLSDEAVKAIRSSKANQYKLAAIHGVAQPQISRIQNNKRRRHLL